MFVSASFNFDIVGLVARIVQHLTIADDSPFIYDEHGALGDIFQADHVRD